MQSIKISNHSVEGECQIKEVSCLKQSVTKTILFFILCLVTCGLFWIISYWLPQTKRKFLYRSASIDEASHFLILNWDDQYSLVRKQQIRFQVDRNTFEDRYGFENRLLKYYYDPILFTVQPVVFDYTETLLDMITNQNFNGLQNEQNFTNLKQTYGECKIYIPLPSYPKLFIDEIFHPFFLFQIFSIFLWLYTGYYLFASILLAMTILSIIFSLRSTRQNIIKLQKMSQYNTDVNERSIRFKTNDHIQKVDSTQLMPGAVINVEEGFKLPCDCVLLQGECLVDEVSLTGESMAVPKYSYDHNSKKLLQGNILYEGTIVVQSNNTKDQQGLACLVTRTGFQTIRGQLIRTILYPKPHSFKFFQESIQFLLILGAIGVVGFIILIPRLINDADAPTVAIVFFLLNSFTIVIPPQLPAAMSFGVSFAILKLKKNKIFCISPPKIIMSGRINTICFDKTGTLTQDGVILKGVVEQQTLIEEVEQVSQKFRDCILCCQSIFNKSNELHGTSLELQLFNFLQGSIQDIPLNGLMKRVFKSPYGQFSLIHIFQFSSDTKLMSVVVRDINNGEVYSFVKGAPELIVQISQKDSLDSMKLIEIDNYFQKGFRVLGFAYKKLANDTTSESARREICESDLIYLGIALFQNDLKPKTKESIEQFLQAQIDCKIVTGDNQLIGLSVAEELGIIPKISKIAIVDFISQESVLEIKIYGTSILRKKGLIQKQVKIKVEQNSQYIDESILSTIAIDESRSITINLSQSQFEKIDYINDFIEFITKENISVTNFVFTGSAFQKIFDQNPYAQSWLNLQQFPEILREILLRSVVFARMKPNQKTLLIQLLQKSNRTVGMVGDGANDCGALKQADAGLALSNTEASISAPFTSNIIDISSFVILLRIGRSALTTNFQCFKFIAAYSIIQYVSTIILAYEFSSMSDMEYLTIDLFVVLPYFVTMALTEPAEELSVQRPSSSLFSWQCMLSVFGQIVFQTIAQITIVVILQQQQFYPGIQTNIDEFEQEGRYVYGTQDSTTIFILSLFLYQASIFAFQISKPFRKPFYTNIYLTSNIIIIWIWCILLTFIPQVGLPQLYTNNTLVDYYKMWLFYVVLYAHIWALIFYLWENLICVKLFIWWNRRKQKKIQESPNYDF